MPERALHISQKSPQDSGAEKVPERGLLSFIKTKLEQAVHPDDIKRMLLRAGFSEEHIHDALTHVRRMHKDAHQDLVAANDFMPALSKAAGGPAGRLDESSSGPAQGGQDSGAGHPFAHSIGHSTLAEHKGLFAGRLRRKDFVLGFLFFFGVGYVILAFSALILAHLTPALWQAMLDTIAADSQGYLLMVVPVLLAPITVISLSLICRRLHNLGLPGGLSFIFLALFVPSFGQIYPIGLFALDFALLALFIVLLTVKGGTEPNRYGPLPGSKGSFFKRILNV